MYIDLELFVRSCQHAIASGEMGKMRRDGGDDAGWGALPLPPLELMPVGRWKFIHLSFISFRCVSSELYTLCERFYRRSFAVVVQRFRLDCVVC